MNTNISLDTFSKDLNQTLWELVRQHFEGGFEFTQPEQLKLAGGKTVDVVTAKAFTSMYTDLKPFKDLTDVLADLAELLRTVESHYGVGHGGKIKCLNAPIAFLDASSETGLKARLWLDFVPLEEQVIH